MTRNLLAPALALLLLPLGGGCSGKSTAGENWLGNEKARIPVIFDYSPTLSDAGALLYLTSNPLVDLLAVTLPGTGEADCEPGVHATRALLTITGHDDVAIGCGRNEPLQGDRDWPQEWLTEVSRWAEMGLLPAVPPEPVLDAEMLLADTLRVATEPVTLIAVGPLTNLGAVLSDQPELVDKLERVVIMGGAVTVPGNVQFSPAAEWNIYIDPEAGRRVIASGAEVTFVPLDATNFLPWTDRLLVRISALNTAAAQTVHDLARSRDTVDGIFLWDELAAMTAMTPDLVTIEAMTVSINDDGAIVVDPTGFSVGVAVAAETERATDEFLRTLNDGSLPPVVPLTAEELDYVVTIGGIHSDSSAAMANLFGRLFVDVSNPRHVVDEFFTEFLGRIEALANQLREVVPPDSLAGAHDALIASLTNLVAYRDEVRTLIVASTATTVDEVFTEIESSNVFNQFELVTVACQTLVDYSFLHAGPRPCAF